MKKDEWYGTLICAYGSSVLLGCSPDFGSKRCYWNHVLRLAKCKSMLPHFRAPAFQCFPPESTAIYLGANVEEDDNRQQMTQAERGAKNFTPGVENIARGLAVTRFQILKSIDDGLQTDASKLQTTFDYEV